MNNDFCEEKIDGKWRVINGRSGERERGLRGAELQMGAPFLKSNRISLAYDLTSNIDPSLINKVALFSCCFVFAISRNMLILYHFRALWGGGRGYGCVWPPWMRL